MTAIAQHECQFAMASDEMWTGKVLLQFEDGSVSGAVVYELEGTLFLQMLVDCWRSLRVDMVLAYMKELRVRSPISDAESTSMTFRRLMQLVLLRLKALKCSFSDKRYYKGPLFNTVYRELEGVWQKHALALMEHSLGV